MGHAWCSLLACNSNLPAHPVFYLAALLGWNDKKGRPRPSAEEGRGSLSPSAEITEKQAVTPSTLSSDRGPRMSQSVGAAETPSSGRLMASVYCSQPWRLASPTSRCRQIWSLARTHFRLQKANVLTWQPDGKGALWGPFDEGTDPIDEGPTPIT